MFRLIHLSSPFTCRFHPLPSFIHKVNRVRSYRWRREDEDRGKRIHRERSGNNIEYKAQSNESFILEERIETNRSAHIGDVIVAVIKKAVPNTPLERSEVIRAATALPSYLIEKDPMILNRSYLASFVSKVCIHLKTYNQNYFFFFFLLLKKKSKKKSFAEWSIK